MHRTRPRAALSIVMASFLLLAAPPAGAQQQQPPAGPAEQVEVNLHLIDVVAVDGSGRALTGLGPKNFAVTIDGEAREVRSADRVTPAPVAPLPAASPAPAPATTAPAEATPPASPVTPRWALLVFDLDRIDPSFREDAVRSARLLLTRSLHPGDRVALAVLHDGEARFLHPFTPVEQFDRDLLNPGLLAMPPGSTAQKVREMVDQVSGCARATEPSRCVSAASAEFMQYTRVGNQAAFDALASLATSLAPLPGRKGLVLFADGYILAPATIVLAAADRYTGVSPETSARLTDTPDWSFEKFLTAATRAHVSVFAMQSGQSLETALGGADSNEGMQRTGRGSTVDPYAYAAREIRFGMQRAAEGTGGRVLSLKAGAATDPGILDRLDSVYTLGITPAPGDSVRSRVKVKLVGVKGKAYAQDHLSRLPEPRRELSATVDAVVPQPGMTPVLRVNLDLANFGIDKAAGERVPISRFSIYWRTLDAAGRVLTDDYSVIEAQRPPGSPASYALSLPSGAAVGAVLVQVYAADLVGGGTVSVSRPLGP